jgi:uncharacterized membrane protein
VVASTLAALAIAWLITLLAAPLLPAAAAAVTYAAASLLCHQRPERSFYLGAYQLPVCARCLGIYAGAAAGGAAALLMGRWRSLTAARRGVSRRVAAITVFALLPTVVTVALEWMGAWYPSNGTRALAGTPAGFVVALVVTRALATVHYGEWAPRRPTAPSPPRSPI